MRDAAPEPLWLAEGAAAEDWPAPEAALPPLWAASPEEAVGCEPSEAEDEAPGAPGGGGGAIVPFMRIVKPLVWPSLEPLVMSYSASR